MCWIISSVFPSILGGVYWPVLLWALAPQGMHRLNSRDTDPVPVLLKALHTGPTHWHFPAWDPNYVPTQSTLLSTVRLDFLTVLVSY